MTDNVRRTGTELEGSMVRGQDAVLILNDVRIETVDLARYIFLSVLESYKKEDLTTF